MKKTVCAAVLLAAMSLSAPVVAADADPIGKFGDWSVYSFTEDGGKVCFMTSAPTSSEASVAGARRGDIAFYITHWAADKTKNVVSTAVGYPLKEGSGVTVTVDSNNYTLATNLSNKPAEKEMAWAPDQATDNALAAAIQRGNKMVVRGTSTRGTRTADTYSLKGTGDAYKAMSAACGF